MRKEVTHLYENAFDIIIQVMNIEKDDLKDDDFIERLATIPSKVMTVDIDKLYNERIKLLYSEIIAFIARIQGGSDTQAYGDTLYDLRDASRDVVEAVKDIKHLQKNLLRYLVASNPFIQKEYNAIRQRLALLLKDLNAIAADSDNEALLALDGVRADLFADDALAGGSLDNLIRNGSITPEMATSLMNDSSYAHDVAKNLVNMAKVIFTPTDSMMREVQESLVLDS
ncbi:MAG: hypothetical protein WBV56_03600 [Azonexus sp.]